jgi:phage recombination protein Bet
MTDKLAKIDDMPQVDIALLADTICKGASAAELKLFANVCNRTGLDPFARQIYAIKRWDSSVGKKVMSAQISIDGMRLVAQRSEEYEGQTEPEYANADGEWTKLWLLDTPPTAARVGVYRKGFRDAIYATALYEEYVQEKGEDKGGGPNKMWLKFPTVMLAKCAEGLALRKAFPNELSGVYTTEEMGTAEDEKQNAEKQAKRVISNQIKELFPEKEQRAGLFDDWKQETGFEGDAKSTTIGEFNNFLEYCKVVHKQKDVVDGEYEDIVPDTTAEEQAKLDKDNEQGELELD